VLVYTTLASDTFRRANESPVNPAVWADGVLGAIPPCQIVSNELECNTGGTGESANESIAIYTGISWPTNQWAQVQVDNLVGGEQPDDSGGDAAILLELLRARTGDQPSASGPAIAFEVDGNTDGTLGAGCGIVIYTFVDGSPYFFLSAEDETDYIATLNPGDVIRMEAFNGILSAFINGVALPLTNNVIPVGMSGDTGIDMFYNTEVSDAQVSNFSAGTMEETSMTILLKTPYLGLVRPQHGENEVEGNTAGVPNEAANLDAIDAAILALNSEDVRSFFAGVPGSSALVAQFVATRAMGFPINAAGSKAVLAVAATASTVLTVKKNGTSVGTITFGASGTTGTFAFAALTELAAGDILTVSNQSGADATAAGIAITFKFTRG
jgi:hypothetical protein